MKNVLSPLVVLLFLQKKLRTSRKTLFSVLFFKKRTFTGKFNFLFITLIGLLLLTTNCAEDDNKDENSDETTEEALPTDFKNTENIVYSRLRAEPDGLNPLLSLNAYAREAYSNVFPYMMNFHPNTHEFTSILIKSAPQIEEIIEGEKVTGLSYTMEILDEAVWDNGQPVTGYDYEFTLKALFNPKMPTQRLRGFYEFITKLEVDEANPKKMTISTNKKYILAEEAIGSMVILPEHHFDPKGILKNYELADLIDQQKAAKIADSDQRLQEFTDEYLLPKFSRESEGIIGCGAYKLKEWVTGQHIILERKDNWWGDNLGDKIPGLENNPKEIHFKIMRDQTSALAALKAQELDAIGQIQPNDFQDLKKDKNFQRYYDLHDPINPAFYFVGMNTKSPKLSDKRVRRALAHLMDVDEVIETVQFGFGQRTVGPVHPNANYYHSGLDLIQQDLEKTQSLLAEAGWEDSNNDGTVDKEIDGERVELELEYLVSSSSNNEKNTALLFQESAKKAGIKVNIVSQEFTVKTQNTVQHKFELSAGGWQASLALFDPKQIWHTDSYRVGGSNYVGFGNQETDALIEEIRTTLEEDKRNELYRKFQEILYEEQPYIFLFFNRNLIALSRRFKAEASSVRPGYFPNTFEIKQ